MAKVIEFSLYVTTARAGFYIHVYRIYLERLPIFYIYIYFVTTFILDCWIRYMCCNKYIQACFAGNK